MPSDHVVTRRDLIAKDLRFRAIVSSSEAEQEDERRERDNEDELRGLGVRSQSVLFLSSAFRYPFSPPDGRRTKISISSVKNRQSDVFRGRPGVGSAPRFHNRSENRKSLLKFYI